MGRRRGFFGRKRAETDEPEAAEGDELMTDIQRRLGYGLPRSGEQEGEQGPEAAPEEDAGGASLPDDTGEWAAAAAQSGQGAPAPAPESRPDPPPAEAPQPRVTRRGDTGERIRIAADQAAQAAEMRAMDEILALED